MKNPWRTWADRLTLLRALVGLPLIMSLATGWSAVAWILLLLGGLSDALDGWLARRGGGGNSWGARLDPLADKLLICAPLVWLASEQRLPLWALWLLLARELLISGWRRDAMDGAPASSSGKAKTILQFLSLLLLLWPRSWGSDAAVDGLHQLGWWLFWPSLFMALLSAASYLRPLQSTEGQR
ncbi:CDP-alcohol phosphatidyltransferase family protein [Synechococcus sp. BS55D]|uniref:CDP-alcohol phosphatidyltransferase family protein n=1 Tax=Synechococcus sp. BS55D TaxID=2055943 RepID=UPI00103C7651|nr:CDP-alcohol phosphatidyltransferase family protein [Synechococcus sp. BS55D]TCD57161.1 CDP-diacylglycerol--glycerol-3-phosphate 3-phosphatidyltransferase [Synechococcus sp. BS55D]